MSLLCPSPPLHSSMCQAFRKPTDTRCHFPMGCENRTLPDGWAETPSLVLGSIYPMTRRRD
eukprot:9487640-Pyramimonas_sp.AAC.2